MNQKPKTLAALQEGEHARVQALRMSGAVRARLQDIGLIPGTEVECVLVSPAGDPKAYRIRGAVIALRMQDAGNVDIDRE